MTVKKNCADDKPAPTEKIKKRRAVIVRPRFRNAPFREQTKAARHAAHHATRARLDGKQWMTVRDDATVRHE